MTENEKYLEWKEFVRDEELASDLANVEGNEEEIFERFYRVDKARCREDGCSGLGLPMVRQIALIHGGEVYLESEEGSGSCFTVEFKV